MAYTDKDLKEHHQDLESSLCPPSNSQFRCPSDYGTCSLCRQATVKMIYAELNSVILYHMFYHCTQIPHSGSCVHYSSFGVGCFKVPLTRPSLATFWLHCNTFKWMRFLPPVPFIFPFSDLTKGFYLFLSEHFFDVFYHPNLNHNHQLIPDHGP